MARARTSSSAVVFAVCLLLSGVLNYGGVLASLVLFNQSSGSHFVTARLKDSSCYPADTRAVRLLSSATRGDASTLMERLGELAFGARCPPEPIEIALLDEPPLETETLPPELLEPPPPPRTIPEKKKKEKEKEPEPEPEKEKEKEKEPEPQPEPQPEPEPEPEPEEPQEKIDFELEQLKMVEQLDQFDEEEAPEDVNYLSNINRDVEEETRAEITNLVQDAEQAKASQLEPTPEPEKGMANEDKIAELREQKSQLAREAPQVKPSPQEQRPEQQDPKPQSLLTMREQAPREHSEAMTQHEALASDATDGNLAPDRAAKALIQKQDQQARTDTHDKSYKFRLAQKDLDALYGADPNARKQFESERQSKRKGVWEDALSRWQSPLENMVPEVRPGNQTALRSRKHPFARYIAQMHRKIHDLWAWGYLDGLDTRARSHELNDPDLWSRVEIVLFSDGRIDKVRTVRTSGNLIFDAAAREIIHAAGPFPNPPSSIRSGNGKIYIHWAFHRDARACGTFGADPFILDNAGQGDRPDPNRVVRSTTSEERADASRRLSKQFPASPPGPEGPTPPSRLRRDPQGQGGGGGGGGDHAGHNHGPGGHGRGGGGGGGTGATSEGPNAPRGESGEAERLQPEPSINDPRAKQAADGWLSALRKGDPDKLGTRTSLPFYAGDQIVARTQEELRGVLSSMIDETRKAAVGDAKIYTAAGIRQKFGSVPPGITEGRGRLFAVASIGGQTSILILEQRFGAWRVIGLSR